MLGQDLFTVCHGLIEDLLHFLIDGSCRFFGVALGRTKITSDKDGMIGTVIQDGSESIGHTIACDHVSRRRCRLLDISGSTGGDIIQKQFFCDPSAQRHYDALVHLTSGLEILQIVIRPV